MSREFISQIKRTHYCGFLRASDAGSEVTLFGWVQNRRDHGQIVFIDLRDRAGLAQVVFDPEVAPQLLKMAEQLRAEWCIGVQGQVRLRGQQKSRTGELVSATNPKLATGEVEVYVTHATVFNRSLTPPFEISDSVQVSEEKRLQYRYLDLRRPSLQKTLMRRSKLSEHTRAFLHAQGFLEIETPFMGKYTPGGARNFLVPSRTEPGAFYALAESPQLYKQLFMVAGFDKYFQIVKCFRDEDLRLDRQPEFTQIDIEMSFVTQEDIFVLVEGLLSTMWKSVLGVDIPTPFQRLDFASAMAKYGNDKPDVRFDLPHVILGPVLNAHKQGGGLDARLAQVLDDGGLVKAMVVPGQYALTRKDIEDLEVYVTGMGAKGLARAKVAEGHAWTGAPLFKATTEALRRDVEAATGARPGDLLLFQFGPAPLVHTVMANLRVYLAKKFGLIPPHGTDGRWSFLWVVNPPLFELDEATGKWGAAHHAFTRPHDDCLPYLEETNFQPERVLGHRYDVVLNGFEIGGGSIRLHQPDVQEKVFRALGIGPNEAREKFGFFVDALRYGAPPHGGIALGMDRISLLAAGAESIRDVIAFPKTQRGSDLMTGAPTPVDDRQLKELHLKPLTPT